MTPARGHTCRSLRSTNTDEDGAFEFPSAYAFFYEVEQYHTPDSICHRTLLLPYNHRLVVNNP